MVEIAPLWQVYASEQGVLDTETAWRLDQKDFHLSVIAHKFIANTLSEILVQLSLNDCKS